MANGIGTLDIFMVVTYQDNKGNDKARKVTLLRQYNTYHDEAVALVQSWKDNNKQNDNIYYQFTVVKGL